VASVAPFFLVQPFRLSLVEFSSASREVNFFDFSFPSRRHFSCFIFSVFSLPAFKMLTFSQIRSAADFPPKAASVAPTNFSLTDPWFETLVTPYSSLKAKRALQVLWKIPIRVAFAALGEF